jgi:hypothetical protein
MRPPCAVRRGRPAPSMGHQQFAVLVDIDTHPMVELAAARVLLLMLEELRSEGIVVQRVRLELDG